MGLWRVHLSITPIKTWVLPASVGGKQLLDLSGFQAVPTPCCSCHTGQSSGSTSALRQRAGFSQGLLKEEIINWGQVLQLKQAVSCTIGRQIQAVLREGWSGYPMLPGDWGAGQRRPGWLCACATVSGQLLHTSLEGDLTDLECYLKPTCPLLFNDI